MKQEAYLKHLFNSFNQGEISTEAYDAGVMNADAFCDDKEAKK